MMFEYTWTDLLLVFSDERRILCRETPKMIALTFLKKLSFFLQIHKHNGRTQLLFAAGIERGIHNRQVLKYQPSVTFRVIFHHLIPLIIIEYWNISLDGTNGWYFRTRQSWMPCSMPVALSNWVDLMHLKALILSK